MPGSWTKLFTSKIMKKSLGDLAIYYTLAILNTIAEDSLDGGKIFESADAFIGEDEDGDTE